jgi:hypothetical protein
MQSQDGHDKMSKAQLTVGVLGSGSNHIGVRILQEH